MPVLAAQTECARHLRPKYFRSIAVVQGVTMRSAFKIEIVHRRLAERVGWQPVSGQNLVETMMGSLSNYTHP